MILKESSDAGSAGREENPASAGGGPEVRSRDGDRDEPRS